MSHELSKTRRAVPARQRRLSVRARGLTLLELVVVLVILAALGTVMITQTAGLTGEARYEQTVRTLEQVEDAVVGRQPVGGEDPTAIPPGFVSDMGRLPEAVADGASFTLAELWDSSLFEAALPADELFFGPRILEGLDEDLEMFSGWRGPYVRLPLGSSELRDGWGGEYELEDGAGGIVTAAGDAIGSVQSNGTGLGDTFDPNLPLEVILLDTSQGIDRVTGVMPVDSLTVEYALPAAATDVQGVVRLYGIANGEPVLLLQSEVFTGVPGTTTSVAVVFDDPAAPGTPLTTLSAVIGPKVLRAYQFDSTMAPPTDATDPLANLTSRTKSAPLRFTMPAGGLGVLPTPLSLEGS
ncbi:MAG: hypothetical protein AAF750_09680 [Planctomycetota bacterium]